LGLLREAAARSLDLRPYPAQLMAAAVLFNGVVAEMKTGEGKTLAIAMTAAIAAQAGKGVHVVTPNPYLAARDSEAMRPMFDLLALTVGVTLPGQNLTQKKEAYGADITYGVHSEFVFDYLRDHLAAYPHQRVQRGLYFVIVDEADSILIDEAGTPLIISEVSSDTLGFVRLADEAVQALCPERDVVVNDKERLAQLTESGYERIGKWLKDRGLISHEQALYTEEQLHLMRHVDAALRARFIYRPDRDYVVHDGEVLIIDEATGRTLPGRRWQGGVHQAVEAVAGVPLRPESQTVAETTYQSYFRLYEHLAGITGTAVRAAEEFEELYGRTILVIPTHRPVIREDFPDLLYINRATKFQGILEDVYVRHHRGQPVLIGTGSVEESEALSKWFEWARLPHRVLNARQTAQEADIIRDAGLPGAITIATNMAGRGTDIHLGGHPEATVEWRDRKERVLLAGGLHVIGTQRHESRRVDEQLRGRAGRQGDPGSSRFYLSLEDNLLCIFGARHLGDLRHLLNSAQDGIWSALLDRTVRRAQQTLEATAFATRRDLFRFDRVITQQRNLVYALRCALLEADIGVSTIETIFTEAVGRLVDTYVEPTSDLADGDLTALIETLRVLYHFNIQPQEELTLGAQVSGSAVKAYCVSASLQAYRKMRESNSEALNEQERLSLLTALDRTWREQLIYLDALREGIHLRSVAQQDPYHSFAKEAAAAFEQFQCEYEDTAAVLLTALPGTHSVQSPNRAHSLTVMPSPLSRLALCPCGSQRRFKHCHGALPASNRVDVKPVSPATASITGLEWICTLGGSPKTRALLTG